MASRFSNDYSRFDDIADSDSDEETSKKTSQRSNDGTYFDMARNFKTPEGVEPVELLPEQQAPQASEQPQQSATPTPTRTTSCPPPCSTTEAQEALASQGLSPSLQPLSKTKKGSAVGRYVFEHQGRKVYEWDQNLDEVNMYIDAPPGVTSASAIYCTITAKHLTLGLRGTKQHYLDESTFSRVVVSDSSWYLDKEEGKYIIFVVLSKAHRGETWESCLKGNSAQFKGNQSMQVDPGTKEEIKQGMLLERFQEEHPGFDFRGAEFNGSAPDPRTFLNGIKHN